MQSLLILLTVAILATLLLYSKRLGTCLLYIVILIIFVGFHATWIMLIITYQDQVSKECCFFIMLYLAVSMFYACYAVHREGRKWQFLNERARAYQQTAGWGDQRSQDEVVAAMREEMRKKRHLVTDADIHRALRSADHPCMSRK